MKNTIEKGVAHILVIRRGSRYLGICKEFGFVEEGGSLEEVKSKLTRGVVLLLNAVKEKPHLEPSLNVRPPFKYNFLFYYVALRSVIAFLFNLFNGEIYQKSIPIRNAQVLP